MTNSLLLIGSLVIIALATYAGFLLMKLRQQTQAQQAKLAEQQQAALQREQAITTDIHYIATAMLEERCELSEGVMRIGKLFAIANLAEQATADYPALFEHFALIESHPIMEARKALPKKQRMQLDLARMKSESALEARILQEAKQIAETYQVTANENH